VVRVDLPDALEKKYPRAAQELGWQFLFASRQLSHCPRTGRLGRHHVYLASLQRAAATGAPILATARVWLLGVSQVAARAEGFLAAASFQRAVKVLTEAALAARLDRLLGPKENTMLGRRIPAGTGLRT
jgi:hypothetical protein